MAFAALTLAALLFTAAGGVAFADGGEDLSENIGSILDGLDLSEIEEYLSQYGSEYVFGFGESAREIIEYLISGDLGLI